MNGLPEIDKIENVSNVSLKVDAHVANISATSSPLDFDANSACGLKSCQLSQENAVATQGVEGLAIPGHFSGIPGHLGGNPGVGLKCPKIMLATMGFCYVFGADVTPLY